MTGQNFTLSREEAGLLVIDVQEKLFARVDRFQEVMGDMLLAIKGFQMMGLPIYVSEQYPEGLGHTVNELKSCLGPAQRYYTKNTFSCIGDKTLKNALLSAHINQWVLIGIEAHVCVLQTAKELLNEGKQVVILNDAISSRSIYNFSTAIAEMRDCGARISSTETVLFELLGNSKAPEFKQFSQLIK